MLHICENLIVAEAYKYYSGQTTMIIKAMDCYDVPAPFSAVRFGIYSVKKSSLNGVDAYWIRRE